MQFSMYFRRVLSRRALLAAALTAFSFPALAASFSVSPIRAELKPGAMSETITVTNDSPNRLRVTIKVMAWTQDASGSDVYAESGDLVYFPRQMDVEPGAKRLVRVGAKNPAQGAERTYRLFVEEAPATLPGAPAAVSFYFRFGVPIFVPPPDGKAQPDIQQPELAAGKLSVVVRNPGNRHFRAARVTFSDGAGWARDVAGWYSLSGTTRTYQVSVPPEVCRSAKTLLVKVESEDSTDFERTLNVDPASCH